MSTLAIGSVGLVAVRRFPRADPMPLGDARPEILRFALHSSIGTGLVSLRSWLAPLLLGAVSEVKQVGLFRAAQAPQQGFAALSSPVRLIMLTEQTRDWERGRESEVLTGVRRYSLAALALMVVVVPLAWWLMPVLIKLVLGADYAEAVDAARLILVAAAIQLVYGWTKSLPVPIGRPNLRIVAHAIETAALIPPLVPFGAEWGATGRRRRSVSTAIFAAVWTVLLLRLKAQPLSSPPEVQAA